MYIYLCAEELLPFIMQVFSGDGNATFGTEDSDRARREGGEAGGAPPALPAHLKEHAGGKLIATTLLR